MNYMLCGDWHGKLHHAKYCLKMAEQQDCKLIIQLGDFGYWEHTENGQLYLNKLSEDCLDKDIEVWWLDGNHENHTLLRAKYDCSTKVAIRDNIYYLPRGYRWTWSDISFMAVGGAYSIDKEWRKPGKSWWPEEMLTDEEVETCIAGGPVDVIMSHDVPQGIDIQRQFIIRGAEFWKADPSSEKNRRQLRKIVDATLPKYLFHGHFHIRYSDSLVYNFGNSECRVVGLNRDESGKASWTVISLDQLTRIV